MPRQGAPAWLAASAACVGGLMASVFGFIILCAVSALLKADVSTVLGSIWRPDAQCFGILPMICATLQLSLSALVLGWCLALGCACFMNGLGPRWCAAILEGVVRLMTAVPTVVYGFVSVFLLVPLVRKHLGGTGLCWLSAAVVLSLQILPSMTLVIDGAIKTASSRMALTCEALGLTAPQGVAWIILPASKKALCSAAMLGFGRAVGDTLIPVMLAGNAVQYARTPIDAMRTLTAHISLVASSEVTGQAYNSLCIAGGILLALGAAASLIIRRLKGENRR
ncbi:MAG: PstC family ABC transporter permease [Pyramidobacter sp.]|jgi:phosphate transport system permease protein